MQLIVSKLNSKEITIETSSPHSNSQNPSTIEDLQTSTVKQAPNELNLDSSNTTLQTNSKFQPRFIIYGKKTLWFSSFGKGKKALKTENPKFSDSTTDPFFSIPIRAQCTTLWSFSKYITYDYQLS